MKTMVIDVMIQGGGKILLYAALQVQPPVQGQHKGHRGLRVSKTADTEI
jgi:hypothetical protein